MNVMIINGSPRSEGITATVLRMMEKELVEKGAVTEYYNLAKRKISHCKGCCFCYKTGHCFMQDDAEMISGKIEVADAVIFGSPTYASNVSGISADKNKGNGEMNMKEYLLLLPIIFIIHDMEEIVGFERFFQKNSWVYQRYPKITRAYRNYSTAGMAAAVYEEFIPFFGVSLLAFYFPNRILYTIWFALMLSLTVHFVIHIVLCIYIRKYIPSLITSLVCLPVCILILQKCLPMLHFDSLTPVLIVTTTVLMMLNLKFAHWVMYRYNKTGK